jgi:DNA-binding transcriptional LysR family regulator
VPIIVNRLLIPALAALCASHPRIRLELVAEARNLSLTRREADIALRLSRPQSDGAALARRLGHLDYAVYAPRGEASDRLPWITYEEGLRHLPQARWIAAAAGNSAPAPLAVSDAEAIVHAVRAGLGKSLLPCFVGDRDTGLQRLGTAEPVLRRELWLLTHAELRHYGRIAAVVAWIKGLILP